MTVLAQRLVDVCASIGIGPDLRASPIPLSAEAFEAVVRDGALVPNGMPRYAEFNQEALAELRQYIRSRAAAMRSPTAEDPTKVSTFHQ